MSGELGTYSFLPWLRNGLASTITTADGDANVTERASVQVDLTLRGEPGGGAAALQRPAGRPVALYGPGDVVGIDPRAIVRTEPRNWVTTFEPNYLAHVEFYDEDFPWRYTPAAPGSGGLRLRPWIALVVLAEGEFSDDLAPGRPLPAITVPDASALPEPGELWAWAHVHVNGGLTADGLPMHTTSTTPVLGELASVLAANADLACSRIVCPRRLKENTAYHAFLVPVFESGRLAGLGLDPSDAPHATASAWDPGGAGPTLPVYSRWYFRTGARQDFESLVRLLEPKPVDPRVGSRDLDVQRPLAGLPGILDADLHGILRLGGALRVPRATLLELMTPAQQAEYERYEEWDVPRPHPFQLSMAAAINLADDYGFTPHPDPVVTMPLYGRWHALQKRLLLERDGTAVDPDDNWVHELNLDPRHRVAAGFGTKVVQRNQEDYMDAAWNQVGAVLEANRRIRQAQLAKEAASALHRRHLEPLLAASSDRALALTAPVHARVVERGATVAHQKAQSFVQPVHTSAPMRRILRPNGPVVRLVPQKTGRDVGMLQRVDSQEVTAAPPKVAPAGVVTLDAVAEVFAKTPEAQRAAQQPQPLTPVPQGPIAGGGLLGNLRNRLAGRLPVRAAAALAPAEALRERALSAQLVDSLPEPARFTIAAPSRKPEVRDSPGEAKRFKSALRDVGTLVEASVKVSAGTPLQPLGVADMAPAVVSAIDPLFTIPKRVLHGVKLPPWLIDLVGEEFQEAMAYPRIDLPMYEPLVDLSKDAFLPNLELVEQNSITLLETHQQFIEAYMVGLNHEMARELLWREYPTDQRGSPFRQFWDARGVFDTDDRSDDELREALYDIPELHLWPKRSQLGDHDHREPPGGAAEEEVVLLIRGELLRKYPTAVIYAHKAEWQETSGLIDPSKERVLAEIEPAEEAKPPPTKVLTPLYEAKVDPDVYFFGFDLTVTEAKGGSGENQTDDAGWFFVIKERPGEPRFGLDIEREGQLQTFNDLAWSDAAGIDEGEHLQASLFASISFQPPGSGEPEKADQHTEDQNAKAAGQSSARWAYVLYQAPVMVAVHAAEMLPRGTP